MTELERRIIMFLAARSAIAARGVLETELFTEMGCPVHTAVAFLLDGGWITAKPTALGDRIFDSYTLSVDGINWAARHLESGDT